MFEILRKNYEIPIRDKNDKLWGVVKYKQATLLECLEYSFEAKQDWFELIIWLVSFIKDNSEIKNDNTIANILKHIDINTLLDKIFNSRFKGYLSSKKWKVSKQEIPFSSYIMSLSKYFSIDPNTVVERYTPEQIAFYIEGVIYNINEETKEWQKRNMINQTKKEIQKETTPEDALKEIQELESRINNKK